MGLVRFLDVQLNSPEESAILNYGKIAIRIQGPRLLTIRWISLIPVCKILLFLYRVYHSSGGSKYLQLDQST